MEFREVAYIVFPSFPTRSLSRPLQHSLFLLQPPALYWRQLPDLRIRDAPGSWRPEHGPCLATIFGKSEGWPWARPKSRLWECPERDVGPVVSHLAPPTPKSRLGLSSFAPGAQPAGLGHCAYSLPGLGRKQRQEAILGPVISLLPGPFWAGLLCRLAMCGCVCARLNEYRQPAPATACRASSSQGSESPSSSAVAISS